MIFLSLVLGIVGLSIFSWLDRVAPIWRAEKMIAEVGPPDGATWKEVKTWLERQRIHSRNVSSLDDRGDYFAVSPRDFKELSPEASGEYIVGIISSPYWWGWMRQIWIYFFFDSEGRLIQRLVKSWEGSL
jgi:hypothetical protein